MTCKINLVNNKGASVLRLKASAHGWNKTPSQAELAHGEGELGGHILVSCRRLPGTWKKPRKGRGTLWPPTKVQAWDRAGKLIVGGWGGIEKYCPSDIVSPSAWRPFQRSLPYLYGTPSVPHLHTHTTTGMGTPYWQLHEPQPELKHQRFWLQTQGLPDRCDTLDRCLPTPKS